MAVIAEHDLLEREEVIVALDAALADAASGSGRLALVAGESGVGKTAAVRAFVDATCPRLPPFYELHAWIWKHNPRGMFDDWNPRVVCPAA
jgi:MoxR-like ATPase